ncbi:MAG: hypothetical protein TREMPRED_005018 [Tremellales sp. Tagirdzhanova-0007]|nr:MAG: hypothetical protein TREMPRED_005018 [Tremellales sp. Tagirdzhanova-0007]
MSDHATTPLSQLPSVGKMTLDNADVLAIVRRHEAIQFKSFTHETAWQVGSTIRTLFLENRGKAGTKPGDPGIVIHIVLWNGHTLFTSSLGSAPRVGPGAWVWIDGKVNTVKRMNKSTLRMCQEMAGSTRSAESQGLPFPEFVPHGGGFPISVRGIDTGPIGCIAVTGMTAQEDHQIIIDALIKCKDLLANEDI